MKGSLTRRHVLCLGLGSAIWGAYGRTATAAETSAVPNKQEGNRMPTLKESNGYGEELEKELERVAAFYSEPGWEQNAIS